MKVFISLPHHGRTEEEIQNDINKYFEELKNDKNIINEDGTWELIDTIHNVNVPANPSRLWYLGEAIKKLNDADLVYFAGEWYTAKGCWVEFIAANLYEKNLTYGYGHPVVAMCVGDALGAIRSTMRMFDDYNNTEEDKTNDQ
jgi:hypothetical protein